MPSGRFYLLMSPAAPDSDLHLLLFGQGINVTAAETNQCRLVALFVVSGEPAAIDKPSLLKATPFCCRVPPPKAANRVPLWYIYQAGNSHSKEGFLPALK